MVSQCRGGGNRPCTQCHGVRSWCHSVVVEATVPVLHSISVLMTVLMTLYTEGRHDGPHDGPHDCPHDGLHDGPHDGPHPLHRRSSLLSPAPGTSDP